MAKLGRKLKLNKQLIETIAGHIKNGLSYQDSCTLAGLSEERLYAYRRQGDKDLANNQDTIFSQFSTALKEACSAFKEWHLQNILAASKGEPVLDEDGKIVGWKNRQWQASAWMLERKYPTEFGRRDTVIVNGDKMQEWLEAFDAVK